MDTQNKRVGFVASAFDLLHTGHLIMLKEAKTQCDHLICALQTDPTLDRQTKNKPVQSVFERYVQLQACKFVDEIVVYDTEKDLIDVLQSYPIDVRILGEEYRNTEFTGKNLPIECFFNTRRHSFSTTELRDRIYQAEMRKNYKE
jgi:glycerol-3-phosphate cytidylyltransferase